MYYHSEKELLDRLSILQQARVYMDTAWYDVSLVAYPTLESTNGRYGLNGPGPLNGADIPRGTIKSRNIYDSIGITAAERLTAGLESLITPQAAFWHGFAQSGMFDTDPEAEVEEWFDVLRNYLFTARYNPMCGFSLANQRALRSMIGLGHGIIFVEEAFTKGPMKTPCYYQFIPVPECYLAVNSQGMHDTNYRVFQKTADQLQKQFGKEKLSHRTQVLLDKADTMDTKVDVLHAVYPDEDSKGKGQIWCSQYLEIEARHVITKGQFFEFPFIVYRWLPIDNSAYAESPTMLALAELQSLQAMGRDSLIASQQQIRPPLASAYAPDVPVNMNPGAVNPKMVDPNTGRLLVQPILTGQTANMFQEIMLLRREQVKDSMYLNLWMSLSQKGIISATEATIRAAEKGELLGPAASRIQHALALMVEREIAIIERKGGFRDGSPLAPPGQLANQHVEVRFTAPIDKMRRAGDAVGIQRTLETMAQIGQFDQSVFDNLDVDETIEIVRDRMGAPRKMFVLPSERDDARQQKQQQQNMANATMGAPGIAKAAESGAKAIKTLQEAQAQGGQAIIPGAAANAA